METVKRILISCCALFGYCALAGADEVDVTTHLKYTVNANEVTVTGFSESFTTGDDYALVIPDEIDGMPVVTIGNAAFLDVTTFTSLTIGKNVKTIGNEAFRRATAVKTITFAPDGVVETLGESAFRGCSELTEFIMPNTVKSAGAMVLQANSKLERVTISNQLTVLSNQFLCNCPLLTTVEIPNSVKEIQSKAFWMSDGGLEEITIPSSVITIASDVFSECYNLKKVTFNCVNIPGEILKEKTSLETLILGSGVKTVGNNAFMGCTSLNSVNIPASVNTLGNGVFQGCTGLASAIIEEGSQLTQLSDNLFSGCVTLSSFTIPATITSIGASCFYQCSQLGSISIPASVNSIGSNAFKECSSLQSVTFADGIQLETIPEGCFSFCSSLAGIDIPASVRRINGAEDNGAFRRSGIKYVNFADNCIVEYLGASAFRGCDELTEFVMPNSVKEVGEMLLQADPKLERVILSNQLKIISSQIVCNCPKLTHIDIPASVTTINNWAFYLSTGFTEIVVPHNVHTLNNYLFKDCSSNLTIDLSACSNVWELYSGNTNVTTKYSVPDGATVILPPGSTATGANVQVVDLGTPAQDEEGYYLIGSIEDYNQFAAIVRGNPTANARLTADIVLTGDELTIGLGTDQNNCIAYGGTFDGQGHTITLNFTGANRINRSYGGLFAWTDGATIKNLAVNGEIETTQPKVGGIVSGIKGTLMMENCMADVDITGIVETLTEMHLGGMLGYTHNADITLTDCVSCGSIQGGSNVKFCSDFFGRITNGTKVTLNNNLAMTDFESQLDFVGRFWIADISNPLENYSGTKNIIVKKGQSTGSGLGITDVDVTSSAALADVINGTVTTILQNGREEEIWVQDPVLGIPMLKLFANYITYKVPSSGIGTFSAKGQVLLPEGLTAYYCNTYNKENAAISVFGIDGNIVPAATGVLLEGEPGATFTLMGACGEAPTITDNELVAVTESTHINATDGSYTNFMMSGGKFIRIADESEDVKMPANRAYLPLLTDAVGNAKNITLLWETTGIESLTSSSSQKGEGSIYNLNGQKLSSPLKGINIINGRKVIVK